MQIRRATLDDLDSLLPLVAAYRTFYRQSPNERGERSFMQEHLRNASGVVFLAFDGDAAVGFTQLFQSYSTVHLGPVLVLEDIFVVPEARRTGAATRLLDAALMHARTIGAVGMFLETAMDNEIAQKVYERAGWLREGRFYKYNAPL